ncbi:MAG: NAD(P)-dependent oxidoreductase, partial [Bacteroidota bacterium]|nr:NAD(P)-dependent oxidoreductase [Bacteroidota bacterium]
VEPIGIDKEKEDKIKLLFSKYDCSFSVFYDRKENEESLIERIADNDIAIVSNIPLRKEVLEKCTNLKLLAIAFTGLDHVDMEYCKERNIEVVNASGYATRAVSELTIGLILDVYRKISEFNHSIRKNEGRNNFLGGEIYQKTVGIIGMGAIGKQTTLLLKAFGTNVLAYSHSTNLVMEREGVRYVDLKTLLQESDIISLHVPLNKETENLINKDTLQLCKPSAILINTSRGRVVNSEDLAFALNNNLLAGAAVDVYENEPPLEENHPLLKAKNCICVPHIAYATKESFDKRINIIVENIEQWLNK